MFKVERKKDARIVRAFVHKVADIPNGVTVSTADLPAGSKLLEGTVVGLDKTTGVYHVVKTAKLAAAADNAAVVYTVKKGHLFKVGDYVCLKTGAAAYAITGISTNATDSTCDDITVGTTLGRAAAKGDALIHSGKTGATNSALPYGKPYAVIGDSFDVRENSNIFSEAWLIGVIKEAVAPIASDEVKAAVPGVVFI